MTGKPASDASARVAASNWRVVLYGNPNTGKTSLFNRLTGLHQRIGNYPGVTVERKEGTVAMADGSGSFSVTDLPGAYGLRASSVDEQVAVDVLTGRLLDGAVPDAAVCVVDAAQLERHLMIAMQVADFGIPQVVAVNFADEARRAGTRIDLEELSRRLGVPVIATVGRDGEGVDELKNAIRHSILEGRRIASTEWGPGVCCAVEFLDESARKVGAELSLPEIRRVLFDSDSVLLKRHWKDDELRRSTVRKARDLMLADGAAPLAAEPLRLRQRIRGILEGIYECTGSGSRLATNRADRLLMHPVLGTVFFLVVMFGIFQAVYFGAGPLMDGIEALTGWLQGLAGDALSSLPMVQSLVTDGVLAGVGSVVIFLPQILILYALIALIEDSGYLARAAFLMDRLFAWAGLNGKSFVPMLSGFACAVPAILAARTIEDSKARTSTALVLPLMSCSARLPVYVLLIGAFVEPRYGPFWAGVALFAMHVLGFAVALPLAWVTNRFVLRTPAMPFLLELPPFRRPSMNDVFWRVVARGQRFLETAGTVIFAISILIWALSYYPHPGTVAEKETEVFLEQQGVASVDGLTEDGLRDLDNHIQSAYVQQSWLARAGKAVQPVMAPAGFDWKITVGILASFPAREVFISTMGILYDLGTDTSEESPALRDRLKAEEWTEGPLMGMPVFSLPAVVALLVFYALCLQCGATVAVLAKELSWPYAVGAFAFMSVLAWVGAVLCYQLLMHWGIS